MKILYSIILSCLLISCGKPKHTPAFKAFDFSYDATFYTCFSIKFTHSDTVFVKQYFRNGDSALLKRNAVYYALLDEQEKNRVDSFVSSINFSSLQDRYVEPILDGTAYQFYVEKDTLTKTVFVLGDKVSIQLRQFANWLGNLKGKLNLIPIDTTIEFGSLHHFLPPEIAPPHVIFLPPKKKIKDR